MSGVKGMRKFATVEERRKAAIDRTNRWRERHPDRVKAHNKKYRDQWDSEHNKFYALWKKYRMTREQFDAKLSAQGGVCDLCKMPVSLEGKGQLAASIDHDHACCDSAYSCGKCLRGIIHKKCNSALGMFGDKVELLKQAIEYLERYLVH